MRVLAACEESQAVTIAFRKKGIECWSCDIMESSGGHPEWHIKGDVSKIINDDWDMIIAFPPCTHLSKAGAVFWEEKRKDGRQKKALDFFMLFLNNDCPKIAIENPPGIMSTLPKWALKIGLENMPHGWKNYDQIIHPWWFGDEKNKPTCLWLKGLPPLIATNIVGRGEIKTDRRGKKYSTWFNSMPKGGIPERQKIRSQTFPGIAEAMAIQWGQWLL